MLTLAVFIFSGLVLMPLQAGAHCQIPRGIYDDHARVKTMREDAATVEKSVKLITERAGKNDAQSQNQLVRWVVNKEKHAQNVISTISDYFLTQRVKTSQEDYAEPLARHHAVIVAAKQARQNSAAQHAAALTTVIKVLEPYYPEHRH